MREDDYCIGFTDGYVRGRDDTVEKFKEKLMDEVMDTGSDTLWKNGKWWISIKRVGEITKEFTGEKE